jgi:hypothetical protein
LAGMCAARVLSEFVDKVTVIERDAYPSAPEFRPGVPQARHVHNLLARGLREFESFFPGFEAWILAERCATAPVWRSARAMTGRPARSRPTWWSMRAVHIQKAVSGCSGWTSAYRRMRLWRGIVVTAHDGVFRSCDAEPMAAL